MIDRHMVCSKFIHIVQKSLETCYRYGTKIARSQIFDSHSEGNGKRTAKTQPLPGSHDRPHTGLAR